MPNKTTDNHLGNEHFLTTSLLAAVQAGEAIQEIYHTGFQVEYKEDHSPLTLADKTAHDIIVQHLLESGIPILSEEDRRVNNQFDLIPQCYWSPFCGQKSELSRH